MQLLVSLVLVALVSPSTLQIVKANNISLLISLSLHHVGSVPSTAWERGFEILPGALVAMDDINQNCSILPGHNLHVTFVDRGRHDSEVLEKFVDLAYHDTHKNFAGISGLLSSTAVTLS